MARLTVAHDSAGRALALRVLAMGLDAADPGQAIRRAVRRSGDTLLVDGTSYSLSAFRRVRIVGVGKAGAPMAQAVEGLLSDRITDGRVVVKYGHAAPTRLVTLHEAGHPVPDDAGAAGARALVDLLKDSAADDLVICLISGGGSALLPLPVEGVSLDDLQTLTGLLLRSGAPIQSINSVRKHLSQLAGGQLARLAYPATMITLILSDVIGSPLDAIASGPTVPDPTSYTQARAILEQYGLRDQVPAAVRHHLARGAAGQVAETPKAGERVFERAQTVVVADNRLAAEAVAAHAAAAGYHPLLLSTFVEGEAREVGRLLAALAKEIVAAGRPVPRPACLVLSGETTVTVRGAGKGGRNQELALAAALAIQGMDGVQIASLGTDGTDGPTDAAGGLVDGATVARATAAGMSAQVALDRNDAYSLLSATGDLLLTGPTHTNVNDLMLVIVHPA